MSEGPDKTVLIAALTQVPIWESLRVNIGPMAWPSDAQEVYRNLALIAGRDTQDNVRSLFDRSKLVVNYVADPAPDLKPMVDLKSDGERILCGSAVIFNGQAVLWPSGKGPWYEQTGD